MKKKVKYIKLNKDVIVKTDEETTKQLLSIVEEFNLEETKLNEVQVGKLFDRFYTVESANHSTGLGLSIAKVLVEQMGGQIQAYYAEEILTITVSFK